MRHRRNILALDQGTTSTRAIIFDRAGRILGSAQRELPQIFPGDGWVEHDPERIWSDALKVCRGALEAAALSAHGLSAPGFSAKDLAGIGITNQRETTLIWERATGRPIHNAIVWQDRRTAQMCQRLKDQGVEAMVGQKTGLLLDPYFSATKAAWLLDNIPGARTGAESGELAFGTVDSFLLFRLTGGKAHFTDATNASRTMLFNINTQSWDQELLELFNIPAAILPEVRDNAADFGMTEADLLGAQVPIAGMAGDQQAALFGQACFKPGMIKSTYGTGCFALLNTGRELIESKNRLLTTIGYRLGGEATYALEGSIFIAGAAIQWLRDGLGLLDHAAQSAEAAASVENTGGVYLVPAFTGLGAPYWDPHARGAILGLTRSTTRNHIIRAALEAQGFQTRDLLRAMALDAGSEPTLLRVDGGLVANDWACAFLADSTGLGVERPRLTETTALGAALMAGLQTGLYGSLEDAARVWQQDRVFTPALDPAARDKLYQGWLAAVERVKS
jgi:glycerol kinase